MLVKMAFRNIWRNRKRTLITAASIFFAVLLAILLKAIQVGAWNNMLDNAVNYYFGYIQVHADGFWEERSIDNLIHFDEFVDEQKNQPIEPVIEWVPRLESFALASNNRTTQGVLVVGVDPRKEQALTGLFERISQGSPNLDAGILIGEGLAENMDLLVGDTIILLGQGYHGANAANQYPITGLVHFAAPNLNNSLVLLKLDQARFLYGTEKDQVTSVVARMDDKEQVPMVMNQLQSSLGNKYEVMDWKEMMPDLMEAKALDEAGGNIMLFILYLIISFGIFGTLLMMTKDRTYEMGVLLSIGMRKRQIFTVLWMEIVLIGLLGSIIAMLVAWPIVQYFETNPIVLGGSMADIYEKFGMEPVIPAMLDPSIFLTQTVIVLVITTLLALYPFYVIRKLNPVSAMKNN